MQIYLVGGAVRDSLLGLAVRERDWVVVGAQSVDFLKQGYTQVGKDFPVFLHPKTHEEYALARTERKTGPGHKGFEVYAQSDVTLEQDLLRRDLTINAMAQDEEGELQDPYNGLQDLKNRVLRHVSGAFSEDPLRVFRLARFYARFSEFEFSIAKETQQLIRDMCASGVLRQISAERIWQEFRKTLTKPHAEKFIQVLRDCGGLADWFVEFSDLEITHLGEIWQVLDTFHAEAAVETNKTQESNKAREANKTEEALDWQKYIALGWVLSKGQANELSERLRVPRLYQRFLVYVSEYGTMLADWESLGHDDLLKLLNTLGAFRQSSRIEALLGVVSRCSGREHDSLVRLINGVSKIGSDDIEQQSTLSGRMLGKAIYAARLKYIQNHR